MEEIVNRVLTSRRAVVAAASMQAVPVVEQALSSVNESK